MAIISTRLQEDVIKAADILGSISAAFSGPRAFGGVGGGERGLISRNSGW